jgi:glycosyltransferase involved in cell wall biosynthesis
MKISFILTRFYPATGGIISHVLYLAHTLSKRGLKIGIHADNLVFVGNRKILLPSSRLKLKDSNIEVVFERVLTSFAPLHVRLLKLKAIRDADVCNIHGHAEAYTLSILPRLGKLGKPIVMTTHGSLISSLYGIVGRMERNQMLHSIKAKLKREIFNSISIKLIDKYVDIIVTPSELEKKVLSMYGISLRRIVVVKNFVPDAYFRFEPQEYESILQQFGLEPFKYMVTVARIDSNKSVHHVIEALAYLREHGIANVKYVLIGSDEGALDYCLSLAKKKSLDKSIVYLGAIYDKALILTLIRYALAFVLPSYIEGQPLSILEAMSQSTPVIVSDTANFIGGAVQHMFNGLIFDYGDVSSLAQAIRVLLEDEDLRKKLGENAYRYAYEHHRLSKAAEKYIRIFKSLHEAYYREVKA